MAIKKIIESDLSGKPDATTVTFGVDEVWFEIDLTSDEQEKFKDALALYMKHARRAELPDEPRKVVPETTVEEREAIRAWGKAQGFDFADRGRIPKFVMQAYDKAHAIQREYPEF